MGSRQVILDQNPKPAMNRMSRLRLDLGSSVRKTFKIQIPLQRTIASRFQEINNLKISATLFILLQIFIFWDSRANFEPDLPLV